MLKVISSQLWKPRLSGILYFSSQTETDVELETSAFRNQLQKVDMSYEAKKMYEIFPDIRDDLLEEQLIHHKQFPELRKTYSNFLNYTVNLEQQHIGKGLLTVYAYKMLEKPLLLTEENLKKACVVAWCHKLMDATLVIDDDIIDNNAKRYNKPTWHTLADVGVDKAILDGPFLETSIWFLLIKHLSTHRHFQDIMKQILQIYAMTNISQRVDLMESKINKFERHTSGPTALGFTLPVLRTALYLANINDKSTHEATESISIDIADFLRNANDFHEVFDPHSINTKANTDIAKGRRTWLAMQAYQRGTSAQKKLLEENYGKNNEESIQKCCEVFNDLKLGEDFIKYREDTYNQIFAKIEREVPNILPKQLFVDFLNFAMTGNLEM